MKNENDSNLIYLYEKFWSCKIRNGFVKIRISNNLVVAQIAEILPVSGSRHNKIVKLKAVDIMGNKLSPTTTSFKLSDLREPTESTLLILD